MHWLDQRSYISLSYILVPLNGVQVNNKMRHPVQMPKVDLVTCPIQPTPVWLKLFHAELLVCIKKHHISNVSESLWIGTIRVHKR
jgi:hypothetical protein